MASKKTYTPMPATALLLLLLTVAILPVDSQPATLRVGVFDCLTQYWYPDQENPSCCNTTDWTSYQAISVNFFIAAYHFNARRADVLPVLGEAWVKSCPTQITIPRYCDTQCYVPRILTDLSYFNDYDALAGFTSSSDVIGSAPYADVVKDLVIVNHWASSAALVDRTLYRKFVRTGQDDSQYAVALFNLLAALNYTSACVLYLNAGAGPALAGTLNQLSVGSGINLVLIQYNPGDPVSMNEAVGLAKATSYNVVLFIGYWADIANNQQGNLPGAAQANNMTGSQLWIFSNYDVPVSTGDIQADTSGQLLALMKGALRVDMVIPASKEYLFDNYTALWETEFPTYVPTINPYLPPFGTEDQYTNCANDELPYQLPDDFFSENSLQYKFAVWAYAYDTIISLGLAACSVNKSHPNSTELYNALLSLSFTGLSGDLAFDNNTGSRLPDSQTVLLYNWQEVQDNGSFAYPTVGQYSYDDAAWTISLSSVQFPDGGTGLSNLPPQVTPPEEDMQYLLYELRVLGYVEIALVQFTCLMCFAWMYAKKHTKIVLQSQPQFVQLILLGCALSSWSILGLVEDDNPNLGWGNVNVGCNFAYCMFCMGYLLAVTALAAKTYRVLSVFNTSTLHTGVSVNRMMLFIACALIMEAVLIVVFQLAGPMHWVREAQIRNSFGFAVQSIGSCQPNSTAAQTLMSLMFMVLVLSCLGTLFLAMAARVAPEEYLEAKHITLAMSVILQVLCVGAPVVFATYTTSVSGRFIILSFIVFFCDMALVGFLFVPKMRRALQHLVTLTSKVSEAGRYEIDVVEGLRIARVRTRFAKFAAEHLVLENMHFLTDVDEWRVTYDSGDVQTHKRKSLALAHMYIENGSLLEVNISDDVKKATLRSVYENDVVDVSCFDLAAKEVAQFTNQGAWNEFCAQGGLYGVEVEEKAVVHRSTTKAVPKSGASVLPSTPKGGANKKNASSHSSRDVVAGLAVSTGDVA
jgi:hypothetical protein